MVWVVWVDCLVQVPISLAIITNSIVLRVYHHELPITIMLFLRWTKALQHI